MIHPGAPPDGIDLWTMLERKYRTDPQQLFERVEAAAMEAGIRLNLSKQRRTYSTIAAHTLLRHAGVRGTQHALTDSLFTATFSMQGISARPMSSRRLPSGMGSAPKKLCV